MRLTKKDFDMEVNSTKFTGILKDGVTLYEALKKLREYEETEKQGMMVRLPFIDKQFVYVLTEYKTIQKMKVSHIQIKNNEICYQSECIECPEHNYGGRYCEEKRICAMRFSNNNYTERGIFFTEAEALQALKERE